MKRKGDEKRKINLAVLILSFAVILTLSFILASSGSLAPSNAGNGTTIKMLWFNVSNIGATDNALTSVTIAIPSSATASVGNITNVTLSDGTNVYYNDSFSSSPIVIPVSATITANTNYTFNFTISSSATDALTIGANVTTISAGTNVTYSTLPYTSSLSTIDSQAPYIEYGSGTTSSSNLSQSYIYVNVSANDTVSNLGTITLYLYNSTGLVNSSANSSLGGTSATYGFNFTNLSDGTYYVNATVNDSFNHINNSLATRTIVLDTTPPVITLISPVASTSSTTNAYNFTFNVTDTNTISNCSLIFDGSIINTLTSVNNSGGNNGMYNSSLSVATHTWSINCTDIAGNVGNSSTRTLIISTVSTSTTTSSSSGGGGYPNFRPSGIQLGEGFEKVLLKNWKVSFEINNESHTLKVENVSNDSAKIIVSSNPQEATLSVGQEKKFDLTGDNYYDLLVKLNSIDTAYYPRANFTIQTIHEEIPSKQENATTGQNQANKGVPSEKKSNLTWLWITIAIVIILILSGIGYKKLKR